MPRVTACVTVNRRPSLGTSGYALIFFAIGNLEFTIEIKMGRIRLLSETVASQVAAGEVVERPASVVKELVENSLDAGARNIDIAIRRGGISLVRVIDDGCGMDRDDALLSLERHATSKIRSAADLQAVATLGFRGEALPSIASVSRFRVSTREAGAIAGTEIIVNGGKIDVVRDGGEAPGTQVEVRSLFYNLPARRKFLRSENTESRNIEHQIHLQAIGHPEIGFSLMRDDRILFQLPATATLGDRIRDLYGVELLQRLVEVNGAASPKIQISGFIGQAGLSRQTRSQQLVFVNGRAIESNLITGAVREGYHTALMKGQYPVTFLFVELDPAAVDVNVHPAKREVRFRDPNGVREAVVRCIQQTLEHARANWQEKFSAPIRPGPAAADSVKATPDLTLRSEVTAPEVTHRELPHLGAVAGVADPGRAPLRNCRAGASPARTPLRFSRRCVCLTITAARYKTRSAAIRDHRRAQQAVCPDGKCERPCPGGSTRRARAGPVRRIAAQNGTAGSAHAKIASPANIRRAAARRRLDRAEFVGPAKDGNRN